MEEGGKVPPDLFQNQISRSARIAADHLTSTLASRISIPAGRRVFPCKSGSKATSQRTLEATRMQTGVMTVGAKETGSIHKMIARF